MRVAAAVALAASPAGALYTSRGQLTIDLSDLSLTSLRRTPWPSTPLLSARLLDGTEVACLNCDAELFTAWVEDLSGPHGVQNVTLACGSSKGMAGPAGGSAAAGKHPNAPEYQDWASGKRGSFLGARAATVGDRDAAVDGSGSPCAITASYLQHTDLEAAKPRLLQLWAERRLILGAGSNPLHQQLGFVEVLLKLARSSPALIPANCKDHRAPSCGALLSDLRPVAKEWQLREVLAATFGSDFLRKQAFDSHLSRAEQRRRVRTLLSALKNSFVFYRQGCLQTQGAGRCEEKATSQLIGQIACGPEDDTSDGVCVFAELRRCGNCSHGTRPFFEFARLHGPLALLGTRRSRDWVMGQCEEFSRAGYALLASLGYTARYVLDFTDHVWLEVQLPRSTDDAVEWVHVDPSEGVLDSPLMYEKGWGKQLTMIFAFTPWSVEHVTHRYTADYEATKLRRGITEDVLEKMLADVNRRLNYELPIDGWGYATNMRPGNWTLEDLSLWSHF